MAITSILITAAFALCGSGPRINCVVDGDTFWLRGEKVRIADINTPETSRPACGAEAARGAAATRRLIVLLIRVRSGLRPVRETVTAMDDCSASSPVTGAVWGSNSSPKGWQSGGADAGEAGVRHEPLPRLPRLHSLGAWAR
ncbi:MAG: hypothetical protein ABWZ75_11725 [Novosphingobium sp.]